MRRGVLVIGLATSMLAGSVSVAAAQPQVTLDAAPDGTLRLVGDGWRPGEHLVVSVGRQVYPASADSTGGFEVRTGLATSGAPAPVAVHRQAGLAAAFAHLDPSEAPEATTNPLAVLFAQALANGVALLGLAFAAAVFAAGSGRVLRARVRQRR